jgi:hypothetical protein
MATPHPLYKPLGYMQLTVGTPAALIEDHTGGDTIPEHARRALIQAEAETIRWRDDGTGPTDSAGMLLLEGADMLYEGDIRAIRLIRDGASDATVNVTFYS